MQPPIGDSRKQLEGEKEMGQVCGLHNTEPVLGENRGDSRICRDGLVLNDGSGSR